MANMIAWIHYKNVQASSLDVSEIDLKIQKGMKVKLQTMWRYQKICEDQRTNWNAHHDRNH
jgi:hypothetical protein